MLKWLTELFEPRDSRSFEQRISDIRAAVGDEKERVEKERLARAEQETAYAIELARKDVNVWLQAIERHVAAKEYGTSTSVNADSWNRENAKRVPGLNLDRLFGVREQKQLDAYAKELTRLLGPPFKASSPTDGEYWAIVVSWN